LKSITKEIIMRIGVIGTRGFPEVQGGIETHCQELYTRLAMKGNNKITVYRRIPYLNEINRKAIFENIRFIDICVPKSKFLETFIHSFLATIHALFQNYDIIHYHNMGPGFFIPLAKISGARIVFTYHNQSYTQQKWNSFARKFLKLSEFISIKRADYIIFISNVLKRKMEEKYHVSDTNSSVVFNGVRIFEKSRDDSFLKNLGIKKHAYILGVGRFTEEKGFDYLIRAYKRTGLDTIKLVLAGDADYPTDYSDNLKTFATMNGIVLAGFVKGEKLNQLYTFARLFVMPSYSEGLPIALLEAMSYDLDVLASDIPANLQVGLSEDDYFHTGDEESLSSSIIKKLASDKKKCFRDVLFERFNWDNIVKDTNNIYKQVMDNL